jgi:serine/threonine protein kinase
MMTNNISTETSMEKLEFGEWTVLRVLGSGTFGKVLLLKNAETHEMVAVKKCHSNSPAVNPDNWKKEIEILKNLKHPGIT